MTAPNTPHGRGQSPTPAQHELPPSGDAEHVVHPDRVLPAESAANGPAGEGSDADAEPDGPVADGTPGGGPRLRPSAAVLGELRIVLALLLGCALLGVLVGVIWYWVAPRVPLYADATSIYLKDPEGEQQAGADGWFAVLGAIAGLLVGAVAYWRGRRREGGLGIVFGSVLGGLLGGWIAWQVGSALGPGHNLSADARKVPLGHVFAAPLDLHARAALVVWPVVALLVIIGGLSLQPHPHPPEE